MSVVWVQLEYLSVVWVQRVSECSVGSTLVSEYRIAEYSGGSTRIVECSVH